MTGHCNGRCQVGWTGAMCEKGSHLTISNTHENLHVLKTECLSTMNCFYIIISWMLIYCVWLKNNSDFFLYLRLICMINKIKCINRPNINAQTINTNTSLSNPICSTKKSHTVSQSMIWSGLDYSIYTMSLIFINMRLSSKVIVLVYVQNAMNSKDSNMSSSYI